MQAFEGMPVVVVPEAVTTVQSSNNGGGGSGGFGSVQQLSPMYIEAASIIITPRVTRGVGQSSHFSLLPDQEFELCAGFEAAKPSSSFAWTALKSANRLWPG